MKTKVKIKLEDEHSIASDTSYVITPYKLNRYTSGMDQEVRGTTDSKGEDTVLLEPAWYPYRIKYKKNSNSVTKEFFVLESDQELYLEDLIIGYLDIDMLSPSGSALAKILKSEIEAKTTLRQILAAKDSAIDSIKNANTATYQARLAELEKYMILFKELVKAIVESKSLILTEQKKLQSKFEKVMSAHADMIQIAKDYVIAKNMGIINLGGHYLWFDSDNKLRWNTRIPTSETDGTAIN